MIRTVKALKDALANGETVAVLNVENQRNRLGIASVGDPVAPCALSALIKRGGVSVLRTDLCGDPMQWGPA